MSSRADWVAFIQEHAQRLLYAGAASDWLPSTLSSEEVTGFAAKLTAIGDELKLLAALYHFSVPTTLDFIKTKLPKLRRSATHVSVSKTQTTRGGIRGKANWPTTVRGRLAGKLDRAMFAVRRAQTSADVPENRLLKLYLENVVNSVNYLNSKLGTNNVPPKIHDVGRSAAKVLKEPLLADVSVERKTSSLMRQRARRNRVPAYRELLRLQEEYESALVAEKWATILRLLKAGWLAPIHNDDLFELYVLVLLLDILESDFGFNAVAVYGLIRPQRDTVAVLSRGTTTIRIYFDQSPNTIFDSKISQYLHVLESYDGLPVGAPPRPDIVCVVTHKAKEQRIILEVKETSDDNYMRGSIYKALGYLHDFRDMWPGEMSAQTPKIIVVFPKGISRKAAATVGELAVASADARNQVSELLAKVLQPPTEPL